MDQQTVARTAADRRRKAAAPDDSDQHLSFPALKCALFAFVREEPCSALFEDAKEHYPGLRCYATIADALTVILARNEVRWHRKELLIRIILWELRRRPHELWSSLLMLAAYPMLIRIYARIQGRALLRDELTHVIVETFLATARSLPLEQLRDRTFLRLRQATQRRLFTLLRDHERALLTERCATAAFLTWWFDERAAAGEGSCWPETAAEQAPRQDFELATAQAQVAFLVENALGVLNSNKLELVIATLVRGERLTSFVDRVYPDLPSQERGRMYQTLKRRHSRALEDLRVALDEVPRTSCQSADRLSPCGPADALLI